MVPRARRSAFRLALRGGLANPVAPRRSAPGQRITALTSPQTDSSRADRIAQSILVGLLCVFPAFGLLRTVSGCVVDPDIGWHLRAAQWIVQHHAFPHVDPFSRAVAGAPWQAYSWLFELVLLRLYTWFGLAGFVVFTAAMLTLIAAAVWHMLSRLQADFSLRILIAAAMLVCLAKLGTPRPWLFTILFFTIEMNILMQSRRDGRTRELFWLPLLFALWANIHIQFIDGLLVLALAAAEPVLARWWKTDTRCASARALWITFGASIAATCLNPYGPAIYKVAWQLGSQAGVLNLLQEMNALSFRTAPDYLLLFMAMAAAAVLFRYRGLPPFETLLLAVAAVLSFRSRRDLWVMAIVAGAILAAGIPTRARKQQHEKTPAWSSWLSAATVLAALVLAAALFHDTNARLRSLMAKELPVDAVDVIKQRHYAGPLFNNYDWGGYLIWTLGEPVTIDGRAALYGDGLMNRSVETWSGKANWASDPNLKSAAVVIAPDSAALTQLLRSDPHFDLAYEDKVAAVFIARKGAPGADNRVAQLNNHAVSQAR